MSDSGLYTHLYAQLRDCAELIDHVIINLETTDGVAGTKEREALVSLLRTLHTAPASNLSATLLANVLRETRTGGRANWNEIADAIDKGNVSPAIIERLEELARALESERADMHARIHGSHAR
jgi:aminoglycoside phosphotransferase (APT) family kinase protein